MKPRMLDLMCGAGGATRGYQLAGFHVTGVDLRPQPNYCGDAFVQGDAMDFPLGGFDAIHASPPCQGYANVTLWRGDQADHPRLIDPMRRLLEATGLPYVIENVRTREIRGDLVLCGSMFGLPIRRHRHFETNWLGVPLVGSCQHRASDMAFEHKAERAYADAMGCDWMTAREARQAIPPVYTEWLGERLMAAVTAKAAA